MTPASVATEQLKNKAWSSQSPEKVLCNSAPLRPDFRQCKQQSVLRPTGPKELKEGKRSGALQIFL